MLNQFLHFLLTLTFSAPLLLPIWGLYRHLLARYKNLIAFLCAAFTLYLSLFYFLAIKLECWYYPPATSFANDVAGKTLGLKILGVPLEDPILFFATTLIIPSATLVFAKLEEGKCSGRALPRLSKITNHSPVKEASGLSERGPKSSTTQTQSGLKKKKLK